MPAVQNEQKDAICNGDKWVDCAQHEECICGRDKPCNFSIPDGTQFIGCHRHDQSALSLLAILNWGNNKVVKKSCSGVWKIDRRPTSDWIKYIVRKENV